MSNDGLPPTFYKEIITNDIDMNLLKQLIIKRYQLLRKIEDFYVKNKAIGDFSSYYYGELEWNSNSNINNDIASHFILAIAYCRADSDKEWFSLQEARLFQVRVTKGYNIPKILSEMGIPLQKISIDTQRDQLLYPKITFYQQKKPDTKYEDIYTVPFEHALSLLSTQRYFIYKGNVYIAESDTTSLLQTIFKEEILKKLKLFAMHYDHILRDCRIRSILSFFEREREIESFRQENQTHSISPDNQIKTGEDIDRLYMKAFPPCMLMIQKHINETSHLFHFGRLQYTLFLKGAGLPLEESLKFFMRKYEKKTPKDKFEKQYAYNIKHSYGQEGKRTNYSPYSCSAICKMNAPSSQECHGCPFKVYSEDKLKQLMFNLGLKEGDIDKVMDKKKTNEFSLCCIRYFEAKFPNSEYEKVGIHPNHYFESAMKVLNAKKKVKIEYEKDKN